MNDQQARQQNVPGRTPEPRAFPVLLTGVTGSLGSQLCRALLAAGHSVSALSRSAGTAPRVAECAQQIRWFPLKDPEAPFREHAPEVVIHCAAVYGRGNESAAEMMEINAVLPVRLAELAAKHKASCFVNTGTVLPPQVNVYALTKHQGEAMLRHLQLPLRVLNLKLQHFYGEGDDPAKFITRLIRQCAVHTPEIPLTEGRQRRDFIHISDTVDAILCLLREAARKPAPAGGYEDVEIGSGIACEVRQVVEQIHSLTRSRSRLLFGALPLRNDEPLATCADIRSLKALGWHPRVSLQEGLARTVRSEMETMKRGML